MIMAQPQQRQLGKRSGSFLLIIFTLPFEHSPIIRELLVEAAKIGVAAAREQLVPRGVDSTLFLERLARQRNRARRAGVIDTRIGEPVVADRQTGADGR